MRICAWEATKGAPFYEQKELRSSGKPRRGVFANGAGELSLFSSSLVASRVQISCSHETLCMGSYEGQHHHNFIRIASVRELEGIGHSADLLKSQLLI